MTISQYIGIAMVVLLVGVVLGYNLLLLIIECGWPGLLWPMGMAGGLGLYLLVAYRLMLGGTL